MKTKLKVLNVYPTEKVYKIGDSYRHDTEYEVEISVVDANVMVVSGGGNASHSINIEYYNGKFSFQVGDEVYKSMVSNIPKTAKVVGKLYDKLGDELDFAKYANLYMLPCIMHSNWKRYMAAYPSKK